MPKKKDFLDELIEAGTKKNPEFPKMVKEAQKKIAAERLSAISWRDIAAAVSIYEADGFRYVEVPWYVSDKAVNATLPKGVVAMRCTATGSSIDLPLLGSAEQAFIELALRGELDLGKYVAASPCFRDDKPDNLHQKTFFKVELIEITEKKPTKEAVQVMAETALSFFHMLEGGDKAKIVETPDGLDIELHGVELGSYGRRSFDGVHWVYGTGLAEPRFSTVVRMNG